MFVFPLVSNAECSYERQAELSRIASNIQLSYTYDVEEGGFPFFIVNAINITNDIYMADNTSGAIARNPEYNFIYELNGVTIDYDIYSNDPNCLDQKILTKTITLPKFNSFSITVDCQKFPNFKYCQTWLNTDGVLREDFDSELEKYIKGEDKSNVTEEKSEIVTNYFFNNIELIVFVILLVLIIPFLIHMKRRM